MVLAACHRNDGDSCQWMIAINTGMYITVGKTVSVSMGWNGREKHARMEASRAFEVSQREPEFRRQKTQKSNTYCTLWPMAQIVRPVRSASDLTSFYRTKRYGIRIKMKINVRRVPDSVWIKNTVVARCAAHKQRELLSSQMKSSMTNTLQYPPGCHIPKDRYGSSSYNNHDPLKTNGAKLWAKAIPFSLCKSNLLTCKVTLAISCIRIYKNTVRVYQIS